MHADLRPQQAVGVLPPDLELRPLDPRLFPGLEVEQLDREAASLGPPGVHAHEHLGPVLRLRAAGTRMNVQQRVPGIIRPAQQVAELERLQLAGDLLGLVIQTTLQAEIDMTLRLHELGQFPGLVHPLPEGAVRLQPALQSLDLLDHLLGPVLIAPHAAVRHDPLELGEAGGLGSDVKASSGDPGAGDQTRENGLPRPRVIPLSHGRLRYEPPPFAKRGAAPHPSRNIDGSPRFLYPSRRSDPARTASYPRRVSRSAPRSNKACRRPCPVPPARRTRASSSRFHP